MKRYPKSAMDYALKQMRKCKTKGYPKGKTPIEGLVALLEAAPTQKAKK